MNRHAVITTVCLLQIIAFEPAAADGVKIDKVYDPYVQASEREVEYRVSAHQDDEGDASQHRLGFGYGFTDRLFGEIYAVGEKTDSESFEWEAFELETKWQLTEQGEYAVDWGLLFEYENERGEDANEFSSTLLLAKDWDAWTGLANLSVIYEWGNDIDNEWETAFSAQLRYRWQALFEPGFELYTGQDTLGLGPVAQGLFRFGGRQQLHWEAGVIFGLDDETPDTTLRVLLEYEF